VQTPRQQLLQKSWRSRSALLATIFAAACASDLGAQSPPSSSQVKVTETTRELDAQTPLNSTLEIRVARRPWMIERTTPPKPSPAATTRPLQPPTPSKSYSGPYASPSYPGPPSLSKFGPKRSIDSRDQRRPQHRAAAPFADLQQPRIPAPPQRSPSAPLQPMVIIEPEQRAPVAPRMEVNNFQPRFDNGGQRPVDASKSQPQLELGGARFPDEQYTLPQLDKGQPWRANADHTQPQRPEPEARPSTSPHSIRQFLEDTTARSTASGEPDAGMTATAKLAETAPTRREPVELDPIEATDLAETTIEEVTVGPPQTELAGPPMDQTERPQASLARSPRVDDEPTSVESPPADVMAESTQPLVPLDYAGYPRSKIDLTDTVARMKNPIRQCLSHYYTQFELVQGRSNWGMLHAIMVYGVDTKVQAGDKTYSSIGWIAGNNICRGQRLVEEQNGSIVVKTGIGLQGHQGQMLAIFSLCDVPENYPIYAGDVRYSLRDVVDAEMLACQSDAELTFTLIGLSHYLDTESIWLSDEGETWTFERLLRAELSKQIVGAACGGTHRLMGFAHALRERRGEGRPIIGQWRRAEDFTDDFIEYAYQLQNSDGSMSTHWFEGREDNGNMDRKVQTTGHMVEWLLTVLPDTELQDPRLVDAVGFLLASMSNNRTNEWSIGPKGHALRSLAMFYERVYKSGPAWRSQRMARGGSASDR
jgi:hypothetical protein